MSRIEGPEETMMRLIEELEGRVRALEERLGLERQIARATRARSEIWTCTECERNFTRALHSWVFPTTAPDGSYEERMVCDECAWRHHGHNPDVQAWFREHYGDVEPNLGLEAERAKSREASGQ